MRVAFVVFVLVAALGGGFGVGCRADDATEASPTAPAEVATATSTATPAPVQTAPPTPTGSPNASPSPSPIPMLVQRTHPPGTTTGIEVVDTVMAAFLARDRDTLIDLVRYEERPCRPAGEGPEYGPPPFCPDGVEAGTPVPMVASVGCHGGYRTPEEIHHQFSFATHTAGLVGVASPLPPYRLSEHGEFAVLFALDFGEHVWGYVIEVGDGGIVGFDGGCGFDPATMWEHYTGEVFLAPPD